jgi:hypothetical protein
MILGRPFLFRIKERWLKKQENATRNPLCMLPKEEGASSLKTAEEFVMLLKEGTGHND